jgi:hypothetical protein
MEPFYEARTWDATTTDLVAEIQDDMFFAEGCGVSRESESREESGFFQKLERGEILQDK